MYIKGTELFCKALKQENIKILFAYPGSAVITLFDQLYQQNDIRMIIPRHEQALVHQADGYARSTGKTGVCLVTSGPGATNIVTGIATANYDSVPLVCFCGQVRRDLVGNNAFQEVDIVGITRGITKHSVMVTERSQLASTIKEAFLIASSGKPGPVVVDLPIDMINEYGDDSYPDTVRVRSNGISSVDNMGQIKKAVKLLELARKPLFLAGGGIHIAGGQEEFTNLAEKLQIPVVSTIMGKGAIPTNHTLYIGNIGMHGHFAANRAVMECDLLCAIGCRFNDRITGRNDQFAPKAEIIHIDIDATSISRNIKADVPIVADAVMAVKALLHDCNCAAHQGWCREIADWDSQYPLKINLDKRLSPSFIIHAINEIFTDCIVVTDVGQHQMWTSQYLELDKNKKMITSGGLGTMGFGFPAALGAKLGNPDRDVICISGDGGFQMNLQELAAAILEKIAVIVIIMNNQYLGMVRQWQQLMYEGRYAGTDLTAGNHGVNRPNQYVPDFILLAESYGVEAVRVFDGEQLVNTMN